MRLCCVPDWKVEPLASWQFLQSACDRPRFALFPNAEEYVSLVASDPRLLLRRPDTSVVIATPGNDVISYISRRRSISRAPAFTMRRTLQKRFIWRFAVIWIYLTHLTRRMLLHTCDTFIYLIRCRLFHNQCCWDIRTIRYSSLLVSCDFVFIFFLILCGNMCSGYCLYRLLVLGESFLSG